MFRNTIGTTPLSDNIAEQYFKERIFEETSSVSPDKSFIITLRALFERQLGDGEKISYRFSSSRSSSNSASADAVRSALDPDSFRNGFVRVHAFCGDNGKAFVEKSDEVFDGYNGWKKLPRPTEYYAKTMCVRVFVHPECKAVAIFCDSAEIRRFHFLEAGILSYFPWYFDPAAGISPDEKALCESITKSDADGFLAAVSAIAESLGFRETYKITALNKFETSFDMKKLETAERELSDLRDSLENFRSRMSDILSSMYDKELYIGGIREKIAQNSGGELGDYFSRNKSLSMLDFDGESITFAVKNVLSYWDDDLARTTIENKSSVLYRSTYKFTSNQMEKIYRAVFIDRSVKLRVCAAFQMRPGAHIGRPHPYEFPKPEFSTYMPNTHIDMYGCIGTHEDEISRMIERHDFIGVVEQCVEATIGFNFGDSTVMSRFSENINGTSDRGYRCNMNAFELPDGTVTNPEGVLDWIEKKEA